MAWAGMKIDKADLVAPKNRGAKKKDKAFTTVWAQYAGKTRSNIDKALNEVIGRYGDGEMIPMPRKTYSASTNWSVTNPTKWDSEDVGMSDMPESAWTDDGESLTTDSAYFEKNKAKIAKYLAEEEVVLNVKCGGQYRMPFFWDERKDKLVATQKVKSTAAVARLREIKALLDEMSKDDGELGSYFHETAVELAKKAARKGRAEYIPKWDCMVEPNEMEQAERFFGS